MILMGSKGGVPKAHAVCRVSFLTTEITERTEIAVLIRSLVSMCAVVIAPVE